MKRFSVLLAVVASFAIAGSAMAAPSRLRTEVGGDNASASVFSSTSARVVVTAVGSYAAIYTSAKSPAGKLLIEVDEGFVLAAGSTISGGSPRITIPIDTNGDGAWDDFASIDGFACGAVVNTDGQTTTDILVSTTNLNCTVSLNGGSGAGTYANWDALAAAQPTWKIAKGQQSFIIADYPQTAATLTSIDLN